MESIKYLNKTVFYLKESTDGFFYMGSLIVFAVNETHLFNEDFSKSVSVDSIFEHYKDAQEYMRFLGCELYMNENKVGFKKIYKQGTDARWRTKKRIMDIYLTSIMKDKLKKEVLSGIIFTTLGIIFAVLFKNESYPVDKRLEYAFLSGACFMWLLDFLAHLATVATLKFIKKEDDKNA